MGRRLQFSDVAYVLSFFLGFYNCDHVLSFLFWMSIAVKRTIVNGITDLVLTADIVHMLWVFGLEPVNL